MDSPQDVPNKARILADGGERNAFEMLAGSQDVVGLLGFSIHDQFLEDWKRAFEDHVGRAPTDVELAIFNLGECTPRRALAYRALAMAQIEGRQRFLQANAKNAFIQLVLVKAARQKAKGKRLRELLEGLRMRARGLGMHPAP